MKKTKRTLRLMRPIARLLAEEGNSLDTKSKRLHRLAEQVNEAEIAQSALLAMMEHTELPLPPKDGEEWDCLNHEKFTLMCSPCHKAWKTGGLFKRQPLMLDGRVG